MRYAFGMMRQLVGLCLGSVLASTVLIAPSSAQTCGEVFSLTRTNVLQQQQVLLKQQVPAMSTEVSPALGERILVFKDVLTQAVDQMLHCTDAGSSAATIENSLNRFLHSRSPGSSISAESKPKEQSEIYGADLKVAVTTPEQDPRLRVVQLSFGIECGVDTLLLVYEPSKRTLVLNAARGRPIASDTPDGFDRTLRWQAPLYTEISGAFGGFFQYVIIPGSPWKIAVAHGTDWCTSRWSGFDLDLLTAGAEPDAPRVLWHQRQGFVIESDPRMVAKPDGFEIRLDVGTIESEQMTRKGVFRYRISGESVQRIAPIAVDGRGFVDAWLQAPWSDARRWSKVEGAAGFEQIHEAFAKTRKDSAVTYAYGPVRACSVKGRYEVEMDAQPGGSQFYAIQEGDGGYTLVNFGTTQDERCNGKDLTKPD